MATKMADPRAAPPIVVKSSLDKKEYRVITLNNGLKALLVSEYNLTHSNNDSNSEYTGTESENESESASESESENESSENGANFKASIDVKQLSRNQSCASKRRRRDSNQSNNSLHEDNDNTCVKRDKQLLTDAACALSVRVGSFHDPPQLPGLAHLLEHVLFMGSAKYPGENEFDSFVSNHGGHSNAYSDYELTTYYFGVNKKYFQESLDKFANFFISPLLLEASIEKEIEAVDSEFHDSYHSDGGRIEHWLSSLALPDHPFKKFPCGNRETLKVIPKDKGINVSHHLREFYETYYSASYMTLTLVSEDTLDTLEEWVRQSFSNIPSNYKSFPSISHCQPVYDNGVFHRLHKVVPVKDSRKLMLSWLLPPTETYYKEKPVEYLSSLLGHEGYGSVLSLLKKNNLATELEAGVSGENYQTNSCFTIFICTVTLSENGLNNIQEVLCIIFQYLKLLQEKGPQERYFEELKLIEENDFKFNEEEDSVELAISLCESMQYYEPEDYLTGNTLFFKYDHELITHLLSYLTPQTSLICLISKQFREECDKKEEWLHIQYTDTAISSEWEREWENLSLHPDLHLPNPNGFIASDFSTVLNDVPQSKYPVVVKETVCYKLWYKREDIFHLPKASVNVSFVTPSNFQVVLKNVVLNELLVKLFNISVMESIYNATLAGLDFSLSVTTTGFCLSLYGYNHKLPDMFKMLVSFLVTFETSENDFILAKEQLLLSLTNSTLKPTKHNKLIRLHLLEKDHFTIASCISTLTTLTLKDYTEFVNNFRKELFVEALVQGNITAKESIELLEFLCRVWKFEPLATERRKPQCFRLPSNSHITIHGTNKDPRSPCTVLTDYYQCSAAEPKEEVMTQLLVDCMSEPCFDVLRTKKQLGYTVYVTDHYTHQVSGLSLTIVTQAQKGSVDYSSQAMKEFIEEFATVLESWSEEKFKSHVDALIDLKEKDDDCLDDEVDRNWAEILNRTYLFDRLEKHVLQLEKVTKDETVSWLRKYTHPSEHYRKLSIKVISQLAPSQNNFKGSCSVNLVQENTSRVPLVMGLYGQSTVLKSIENYLVPSDSREECVNNLITVILTEEDVEDFKCNLQIYYF